jgi:uncharacterized protein YktA (UPF0223 family)
MNEQANERANERTNSTAAVFWAQVRSLALSHALALFNPHQEWTGAATFAKSKTMSAKNAWGTTTGYAEQLIDKGMEATRAQQLENWNNQQEVINKKRQQKYMTEEFDKVSGEENWRSLSSFGVERNQVRKRTMRFV